MKITKELRKKIDEFIDKSHVARLRFLNHALATRLGDDGLSRTHGAVVLTMFVSKEPLEPSQISERIQVPRQTLTSVLDALERDLLLFRADHPSDRRRKILQLTDKGSEVAFKIFERLRKYEESLLDILSEEEVSFLDRIHRKLCDRMIELDNIN